MRGRRVSFRDRRAGLTLPASGAPGGGTAEEMRVTSSRYTTVLHLTRGDLGINTVDSVRNACLRFCPFLRLNYWRFIIEDRRRFAFASKTA